MVIFGPFLAKIAYLRPILNSYMTYFHELYHGNCALRYVEGILKLKKLDFRGLKGQFEVKRARFRGANS